MSRAEDNDPGPPTENKTATADISDAAPTKLIINRTTGGEIMLNIHNDFINLELSPATEEPRGDYLGRWVPHPHEGGLGPVDVYIDEAESHFEGRGKTASSTEWLTRWQRFEFMMHPLFAWVLAQVDKDVLNRTREEVNFINEVLPGIRQVPLRSPTLPPAEHTNAYIIGDQRVIIVDPASFEDEERDKLGQVLAKLQNQGVHLEAVVLTHHHFDHYGAAQWVAERFNIPIWAHEYTAQKLQGELKIERFLDEGDVIELGLDHSGRNFRLKLLFTPGHAAGHIVLCDERAGSNAMIVGDMVAAVGTIIIDPDEGDMAQYIQALRRLLDRKPRCLFPAHGPPIIDGPKKLRQYIKHRLAREARVFEALLKNGPGQAADLLNYAYADTPQALHGLAERACLAHLIKLEHEGRVESDAGIYLALKH